MRFSCLFPPHTAVGVHFEDGADVGGDPVEVLAAHPLAGARPAVPRQTLHEAHGEHRRHLQQRQAPARRRHEVHHAAVAARRGLDEGAHLFGVNIFVKQKIFLFYTDKILYWYHLIWNAEDVLAADPLAGLHPALGRDGVEVAEREHGRDLQHWRAHRPAHLDV